MTSFAILIIGARIHPKEGNCNEPREMPMVDSHAQPLELSFPKYMSCTSGSFSAFVAVEELSQLFYTRVPSM